VPESPKIVFTPSDVPMYEMPNGKFRDSFMLTDQTCGAKQFSAGLVWFAPQNTEGHLDVHTFDEAFYIISGSATFFAGGVSYQVKAGDVVYCPAGMEHTYYTGEDHLKIFWLIAVNWGELASIQEEVKTQWHVVDANSGWHAAL